MSLSGQADREKYVLNTFQKHKVMVRWENKASQIDGS